MIERRRRPKPPQLKKWCKRKEELVGLLGSLTQMIRMRMTLQKEMMHLPPLRRKWLKK